jgi:hypothetical protein
MSLGSLILAATVALTAAGQAQTLPGSPAIPGDPSAGNFALPSAAGLGGQRRQPTRQALRQGAGTDTPQVQREIDELYQEIMRRSAPPAER